MIKSQQMDINKEKIKKAIKEIIEAIGEDVARPELQKTPERVADMYEEIFSGIHNDPKDDIKVLTEAHSEQMIVVKNISFYSICEHHMIPFFGKAHVIYIPKNNKITGFSSICRLVETVAKRPQLQERMGSVIANTIMETLAPYGVMVVLEAEHLCMSMRGIKKQGTGILTSTIRGTFYDDASARSEALSLIKD